MDEEEKRQLRVGIVAVCTALLLYKAKTPPTTKAAAKKIVDQAEAIAELVLATYSG